MPGRDHKKSNKVLLLAIVGGVLAFILAMSCTLVCLLWKRRRTHAISFDVFETSQKHTIGGWLPNTVQYSEAVCVFTEHVGIAGMAKQLSGSSMG